MQQENPTQIFISYRRDDTDSEALNIFFALEKAFGKIVFKDNFSIKPGENWEKTILDGLKNAKVLLAVIGKKWMALDEKSRRKIDLEDDWVRLEIHSALEMGKIVIPLFVDGATPPSKESFQHPNLVVIQEKFPSHQGIHVNSRQLDQALHKLIGEDLPKYGIQRLPPEPGIVPAAIDLLADYPLNISLGKDKLPAPYVGLRPFDTTESFLFFGRDQDILRLIKKLESDSSDKKIILYHGCSGVGKSSLLLAGLVLRLKNQGWDVPKPRRRKKEVGAPQHLLDLIENSEAAQPRLLVLDQLEEIFSNPSAEPEQEIADFQKALAQFYQVCDNARLLLSFRSDYFTQVRKILDDIDLPWDEMELFPLDRETVLQAITGVTEKPQLKALYNLQFDPPGLPEDIRDDVLKDKNSSHVTPLLQYQLEKLFGKAAPDWAATKESPRVTITAAHYSEDFRKDNLERMLDAEFEELQKDWKTHTESGLALDVLHQYITDQATAGSRKDADIWGLYEHISDFPAFFDYLKNRRSLLIGNRTEEGEAPGARLAHDSLAPLLLARFRDADAPGQRAWQILETKQKDIKKGLRPTLLAPDDLEIVEKGRTGMRSIPLLEGLIAESEQEKQLREADLREKTAQIFDGYADVGIDLIASLDHKKALEKMMLAVQWDINFELKKQKLQAPLEELLFFFAEGGINFDLARKSAELLNTLASDETFQAVLKKCVDEGWNDRDKFKPLLKSLPSFEVLMARYYPEMIPIPGDTFTIGSPETEKPRYADELQHEVALDSFKLASTPVTFYQYALYCEANEKSIVSMTPSWGRFGDHPLVNINWYDAAAFCNWLSAHQGLKPCYDIKKERDSDKNNQMPNDYQKWLVELDKKANGFRLPTSAEWEFAARGGTKKQSFKYAGSDDPNEVGWYWENSGDKPLSGTWENSRVLDNNGRTHPVKEKAEKGIGLYDMSGNVYEWCWDWYDEAYYAACKEKEPVKKPFGPESSKSGRVLRGGAWNSYDISCRVAVRYWNVPYDRDSTVGFRLAQD